MSEVIDIRHLDAVDFAPLFEAEARAWDQGMHWDYAPSVRLISACLAERRLSGYALVEGRRVKGYSFFVYEGAKALIGDLFVMPGGAALRNASRLLEHVLETLTNTPGICRIEAQLPHVEFGEIEPRFRAYEFRGYVRRFMATSLDRIPAPHPEAAQSRAFAFEPWERKHDRQVSDLIRSAYRGHVDAAINDQYQSAEGAAHLVENIFRIHACGDEIPGGSLVGFHRPTHRLVAATALTAVRRSSAHIPQIVVSREFQSQGLGTALLAQSCEQARRQAFGEISLTVTEENRVAVRLYEHLGFQTLRTFGAFVWTGPGVGRNAWLSAW